VGEVDVFVPKTQSTRFRIAAPFTTYRTTQCNYRSGDSVDQGSDAALPIRADLIFGREQPILCRRRDRRHLQGLGQ
jgi:hypothetical protein